MISNKLVPISPDMLQDRSPSGAAAVAGEGADFLAALLQSKGVPGAEQVTPEMLEAWMRGEQLPDAQSGLQDIAELVQEQLADVTAVPAAPVQVTTDPQQLLKLMMGAGAADEAMPGAELAAGGAVRGRAAFLAQLKQNMEQLPQTALDTVQAGQSAQGFRSVLAGATPTTTDVPTLRLDHPVQQPGFGQAVGERVVWMANQQVQQAKIRLDPPHLGPLEISLSLKEDQASVSIIAHHSVTREALQADMPRLREMLGENGFSAVDVNVAQDDGRGQSANSEAQTGQAGGAGVGGGEIADGGSAEAVPVRVGQGLVDHYA